MLVIENGTHAEWTWRRTLDGGVEPADEAVLIRNLDCPQQLAAPGGSQGFPQSGGVGRAGGSAVVASVLALGAAAANAGLLADDE